jgi:hypothetical protein
VIRYLALLPFRMARAAALVPVRDADEALCLSQGCRELPLLMEAYVERLDALEVSS